MSRPHCPLWDCDGRTEACTPKDCPFILRAERDAALAELARTREAMERLVGRACDERDAALAVVERVRELHKPWASSLSPVCVVCGEDVGRGVYDQYPCATVQALAAVPEGTGRCYCPYG